MDGRKLAIKKLLQRLAIIIFVILIIELGLFLLGGLNVKTIVAKWVEIDKGYWTDVLFIRKETLLRAPVDGDLTIQVNSSSRVSSGELLSYINVHSKSVNTSELNIQTQIALESLVREERTYRVDLERIISEIQEITASPKRVRKSKPNPVDLETLRKEKIRITKIVQATHSKLVDLQHKIKDQLKQQPLIIAPEPGYLFYQYDGWEENFTPESSQKIKEGDFQRHYDLKNANSQVGAGEIIGKIIAPFEQTMMITAVSSITGEPKSGDTWWLKNKENLLPINVQDVHELSPKKVLITFKDAIFYQEYLPYRTSQIFVVYRRTSGIGIPRRSIYRIQGETNVKILKGDGFELKKIRVIETDNNYAIVEGLEFGTTIISR